jgi:hypothetical protein
VSPPRASAGAALLAAIVLSSPLHAQHWRTIDVGRQLRDTGALAVRVDYGSGKLAVRAGAAPILYQMSLRYDGDLAAPLYAYDGASRTLTVGTRKGAMRFGGVGDDERGSDLKLDLGGVPLDLAVDLGAVEADLDLSRLRLNRLKVDAGASSTRIRFDVPNPIPMRSVDIDVGAAGLRVEQLANANAKEVRVKATAGGADVDLGGAWAQDMDLTVEVVLGGMTIHVPSDVGVQLTVDRFLASVSPEGLTKRGDVYLSDNWSSARRRLRIRARAMLGKLEVDRTGR